MRVCAANEYLPPTALPNEGAGGNGTHPKGGNAGRIDRAVLAFVELLFHFNMFPIACRIRKKKWNDVNLSRWRARWRHW